ncbi:methyltransferase domain-containing protein [bacterium]|nr:methyltransferase domain-containing protein [bacterium]
MKKFWDDRYSQDSFAYGTRPNDFLAETASRIPPNSDILSIGEGEGRNAVFLATLGHHVVATDQSDIGMAKAHKLAEQSGCAITTIASDLAEFDFGEQRYDAIISIFCHLPQQLRNKVHSSIRKSLRKGGLYIIESYSPDQLLQNTGGPKDVTWLVTLDELQQEFTGFNIIHAQSLARDVVEGTHHTGSAAVTQFICQKP